MDIFVGSLSFKLKESELREAFEKFGKVSTAKIIIDKITRQSKGFGFVEMPDENEARLAISSLNGAEMYGRALVVNESQKKEQRPGGPPSGGFPRNDFRRDDNNSRPRPSSDTPYRSSTGYTPREKAPDSDSDDDDSDKGKSPGGSSAGSFGTAERKAPERRHFTPNDKSHDRGGHSNKSRSDGRPNRSTEPYVKKGGASRRDYFQTDDDD